MGNKHLTAEVAGLTLHFHSHGDAAWDYSPLKNFITADDFTGANDNADNIDIEVRLGRDIAPDADARLLFSARMDATADNFETEWYLYSLPSGDEMIVQLRGSGNDVVAASIRFGKQNATLTIHPQDEAHFTLISYPLFNIFLSRQLARRGGFLIHSSVVEDVDGQGLLFTAVSGTGKSTIAHIFEGEGATLVNDDMIAVRTSADGPATAYALPMPYYVQPVRRTRLRGFFVISQSPTNKLTQLNAAEGVARVLANVVQQPFCKEAAANTLSNVIAATAHARIFSLGFKPDAEVVGTVRTALRAK